MGENGKIQKPRFSLKFQGKTGLNHLQKVLTLLTLLTLLTKVGILPLIFTRKYFRSPQSLM